MKLRSFVVGIVATFMAGPVLARLTPEQLKSLPAPADRKVDFSRDIQPILENACVKCHGRGKAKGAFSLETREAFLRGGDSGPAAVLGRSAESLVVELVSGLDPENVMPQKGSKLKPEQVGLLRAWIDQGLDWKASVNFARRPPLNFNARAPELPAPHRGASHPADRFLGAYFESRGVKPERPVDDRVFARRAYLDIVGVLPTPAEMDQFLSDRRPDKRERLVSAVLSDNKRYAEHWLSFWNDLLRNDYTGTGYIDGGRKPISTWLYTVLATNAPFDQFVRELLSPTVASEGFSKGIVWRGVVNASQTPPMQAAQNISQVFMGVNLKCASCHDSFINDWALADAYALANVYADDSLLIYQCDKPTGKKAGMGFIFPDLGSIDAAAPKPQRMQRLAEIVTAKQNGRLSRTIVNRLWARFFGRGLVEPVDDMDQVAWNQDLLDWLAEDFVAHGYDLKHTMTVLLTSQAYALPSVSLDDQKHPDFVFRGPLIRRLTAEQFRDALGQLTGVWYSTPASGINLSAAAADSSMPLPAGLRWIWSEAGAAAAARAETVYFWKTVELTETPKEAWAAVACDNSYTLYVNGAKAGSGKDWTEPNLIDLRPHLHVGTNLLAVAAINHTPDNKVPPADKPVTDEGANPAGFILAARVVTPTHTNQIQTDRSWVWSKSKTDGWEKQAPAPSDSNAAELGAAQLAPWNVERVLAGTYALSKSHADVRASLVSADPLTRALGRPPREQVMTTRPSTATTLQALELTNGETLNKLLARGAEKLLAAKPASAADFVKELYSRALSRKPTSAELRLSESLLGKELQKEQVEDLLWSVAMLPEFQLIY